MSELETLEIEAMREYNSAIEKIVRTKEFYGKFDTERSKKSSKSSALEIVAKATEKLQILFDKGKIKEGGYQELVRKLRLEAIKPFSQTERKSEEGSINLTYLARSIE